VPAPVCASYAESKGKWDELVEVEGVKIIIEPNALMHVLGTKMDFVEDRLRWVCLTHTVCAYV
jgi:Fe-S cluster assembly iron-binding protein IscA